MSAIFGIMHLDGKPVSREDLERMDAALEAFGPDGHGIWSSGNVGLGLREMHFTPEDRFNQLPLKSADGLRVLVCDARVDNRPELMHLLDIRPADAKEMPDSAFIMRAYEKWGLDCAEHLIGDIAFALWDQREQQLLLARSPVSGRPIFYFSANNQIIFSTMPQGLFALSIVPKKLSPERIADYLALTDNYTYESFFRYISHLPTGNILTINKHSQSTLNFWQPTQKKTVQFAHEDDYVQAFIELFERAVTCQLRSLTPVGIMMSGGLDSSSVAAIAATILQKQGKRLSSYTEVPQTGFLGNVPLGQYADETPYIQAMKKRYDNIDTNFVRTDHCFFLNNIQHFFQASYAPFRNASNRVWFEAILKEAKLQGTRIVLTGGQGNLTMSRSGNNPLPELIRQGKLFQLLSELKTIKQRNQSISLIRCLISKGLMPLLPEPLWEFVQSVRGKRPEMCPWHSYSALNSGFAKNYNVEARAHNAGHNFRRSYNINSVEQIREMLIRGSEYGSHIDQSYRHLFRIELRDPTVDLRIVEFCLSLPEEQYRQKGISRRLIRRSMSEKLPIEIIGNQQRGLQSADWFGRINLSQHTILEKIENWNHSNYLPQILDLKRLKNIVSSLTQLSPNSSETNKNLRIILEFSLTTGAFIEWLESKDFSI